MGPRLHLPLLLLTTMLPSSAQENAGQLPDGQGKSAVMKICSSCHEIDTVIGSRHTRMGWQQTVDDMISRGAEGTDEEMSSVVEYLTTFFGKTNVNTASVEELEKSLNLPVAEAQAIVKYREQNGRFTDFEQLQKVSGVNREELQAKRSRIAFSL